MNNDETLQFPRARLYGFSRHPVKNFVFPGTIPARTSNDNDIPNPYVDGFLLEEATPLDLKLLDWFEGDEYSRETVQVQVMSTPKKDSSQDQSERQSQGEFIEAQVYIW